MPVLAARWLADEPGVLHRRVEAALAFVDVSGFTALTERLAARGKAGAEEVSDLVGGCFTAMLEVAYEHGGEMLKWGGDAALLIFEEPEPALAACAATARMCALMERIGSLRTTVGRVTLRVSVGVHTGEVDLYLLGGRHRELIVTGPAATRVALMEAAAESGEVVASPETAARLPAPLVGATKGPGCLIEPPAGDAWVQRKAISPAALPQGVDLGQLLPAPTRDHLLGGGEHDEHRHATVAFIEFRGVDQLIEAEGPGAVLPSLVRIVDNAQEAAAVEGVNFHATDVGPDGGKILVLGGIPVVRGNDEERVLRATLSVVSGGGGRLGLRAGVNAGRVFMHESGPPYRRIHSFAGDAVNLAARVMGKAGAGQVLATGAVLDRTRTSFEAERLAPFTVKGKTEPVEAFVVGRIRHAAGPSGDHTPFVVRQGELEELLEAARSVRPGRGAVVEVVAEPGMGKSVLVAQAMARWPLPTYRLACEEYGSATPYLPFRWLLRAILELPEQAPATAVAARLGAAVASDAPDLAPWLPLLGDVLGVSLPATAEVEQLERQFVRSRLEEATVAFISATLTEPRAVVFEDAHDLDEASRSLLTRLAVVAAERPWLLVITRRPEGEEPLGEDPPPRRLMVLEPLTAADASSLLAAVADELALSVDQRRILVERAGGNPLFVHELAVAARAAGSVEGLPDRLEPLLAAKVDRLDPADRQILRAAAVLGVQFDPAIVAELLDERSRPRILDDTVWRRLGEYVVADGGRIRRFAHALVRDAAYEGLSYRRRRHLHGLAADAVTKRSGAPEDQADLLSLHSLHAGRFDDAWRYGRIAGERALAVYANADAVTFFSRALEASHHLRANQRPEVAIVAEALGDAAERAGRFDAAHHGYRLARRASRSEVDHARLMRKTGVIYERQSRYSQALRCYTRGRGMVRLEQGPPGVERAELAIAYAASRYRQGRFRDCISWSALAAGEAQAVGHPHGVAHALYLEDQARSDMAEEPGGQARRALEIFEELGDQTSQGRVLNNLGRQSHQRGRWNEALDFYRRSKTILGRVGDVVGEAIEDYNIGEILSDQGHYPGAAELLEAARVTWRATNYPIGVGVATSSLGRQATRTGRLDVAATLLAEARERFEAIGAAYFVAETEGRLAELAALGASHEEALAATSFFLVRLGGLAGTEFLVPMGRRLCGIAHARAGHYEQATAELDAAVAAAELVSASYELALSLAARAVVGGDIGFTWTGSAVWNPGGDARRAKTLFDELGVVDCPVSSVADRWPNGDLARALVSSAARAGRMPAAPVTRDQRVGAADPS